MFSKKKKREVLARSLTIGVRTQLCKECQGFYARACEVEGKPALFHRWVEDSRALLRVPAFIRHEDQETLIRCFKTRDVVPNGCSTEVIRSTFALVEYPDGSVGMVKPELVTFLDRGCDS